MEADQLPPIFCLSLARAADRRTRMIARLDSLGSPYEIVDAVDGRELDLSQLGGRLRQDKMRRKKSRCLTAAEIGCYLSHCNLLRRIADEKIAVAIVVEDDAGFAPDFAEVAAAAARIPHPWDMILLHTHPKRKTEKTLCRLGVAGRVVCRMAERTAGTAGYLISLSGAKKLLEHCNEISEPVDVRFSAYWESGIRYYAVSPRVVIEDGSETMIPTDKKLLKNPNLPEWLCSKFWRLSQQARCRLYNLRNPLPQREGE